MITCFIRDCDGLSVVCANDIVFGYENDDNGNHPYVALSNGSNVLKSYDLRLISQYSKEVALAFAEGKIDWSKYLFMYVDSYSDSEYDAFKENMAENGEFVDDSDDANLNSEEEVDVSKDDVLLFIDKFKFKHKSELEDVFSNGNCYYFAMILKERFGGQLYYLRMENHFVCKIGNYVYDIRGEYRGYETPMKWSDFKKDDELASSRVERDCIRFESRTKGIDGTWR